MSFHLGVHPHVKPKNLDVVVKEVRAYVVGSKEEEKEAGVTLFFLESFEGNRTLLFPTLDWL